MVWLQWKTEIYIKLIEEYLTGKQVLYLLPETHHSTGWEAKGIFEIE
jgi:primosomal protein N'